MGICTSNLTIGKHVDEMIPKAEKGKACIRILGAIRRGGRCLVY